MTSRGVGTDGARWELVQSRRVWCRPNKQPFPSVQPPTRQFDCWTSQLQSDAPDFLPTISPKKDDPQRRRLGIPGKTPHARPSAVHRTTSPSFPNGISRAALRKMIRHFTVNVYSYVGSGVQRHAHSMHQSWHSVPGSDLHKSRGAVPIV